MGYTHHANQIILCLSQYESAMQGRNFCLLGKGVTVSNVQKTSKSGSTLKILSVSSLVGLYNANMEELQLCANVNPCSEENTDETDIREAVLLDFEANLLQQAAQIPLRTRADLQGLMDIWKKMSSLQTDEFPSPSDRIVMNIFRHLSDEKFTDALRSRD